MTAICDAVMSDLRGLGSSEIVLVKRGADANLAEKPKTQKAIILADTCALKSP